MFCICLGVCVECCVIYCGFCRFFERLRDSSECLAAKEGRSSPKSIFPALGNSLSANCILSGLIAPKIFFLRVIVVMWLGLGLGLNQIDIRIAVKWLTLPRLTRLLSVLNGHVNNKVGQPNLTRRVG